MQPAVSWTEHDPALVIAAHEAGRQVLHQWSARSAGDRHISSHPHVRKSSISRELFHDWWLGKYADEFKTVEHPALKIMTQLFNMVKAGEGNPFTHPSISAADGIALLGSDSMSGAEDYLRSEQYSQIAESESAMLQVDASEWWTAVGIRLVDRIQERKSQSVRN